MTKGGITTVAIVLALTTMPGFAQQRSPVQAKLVIPDAKVLPGVPFEMWIELTNPSDSAVAVALSPHLIVRPERGDRFEITPEDVPVLLRDRGRRLGVLLLAPRGKRTLTLPIEHGRGAEFFDDWRLSPPGHYTLAIRLGAFSQDESAPMPPEYLGAVFTNEVSVERIVPAGSDEKVWGRMQQIAHGHWSQDCERITRSAGQKVVCTTEDGASVANEVIAKYGDSDYFPYMVLESTDLRMILDAIARFPDSPVIELLHMKAWDMTRGACGLNVANSSVCETESAKVQRSIRPTTRIQAFGTPDLEKHPASQ